MEWLIAPVLLIKITSVKKFDEAIYQNISDYSMRPIAKDTALDLMFGLDGDTSGNSMQSTANNKALDLMDNKNEYGWHDATSEYVDTSDHNAHQFNAKDR